MFKTLNRDNSSYDRRFYERFTGDWRATRGLSSPGVGGGAAACGWRGGATFGGGLGGWCGGYGR